MVGTPPVVELSTPHSFVPRRILNTPLSPQSTFHEFTINQYGTPYSSPQPINFTA